MQLSVLQGETGRVTGQKAVNEVIDRKLVATPQNYELLLHIQNDWTPSLTAAVKEYNQTGHEIDEIIAEQLYDKHLGNASLDHTVVQTGARLAMELAGTLEMLRSAGNRTEAFSGNLDEAATALESGRLEGSQLMMLVKSLSEATRIMSVENSELTRRLESSSSEVNALREHLNRVRTEALTDILTGLANRRMFDETLRMRVDEANSLGYPLTLAILDVDHFKIFNDTWGHQTGDQVLRFVGSILRGCALDDMLVARYGGEEFTVILPRLKAEEAIATIEKIRISVQNKQLRRKSTNEDLGNVTISAGMAELLPNESGTSLIKRADQMLYTSKKQGRNRLTIWSAEKSAVA